MDVMSMIPVNSNCVWDDGGAAACISAHAGTNR